MSEKISEPSNATDREIISSRILNFSRELVFRAWEEPGHLAKWWEPKGFTNLFHEFNFKPGGAWNFIMRSPDNHDYDNKIVFIEIVKPERIMLDHVSNPGFRATTTLEAMAANKTKIVYRMSFESAAVCENIKKFAVNANEEKFDRLEAELVKMG